MTQHLDWLAHRAATVPHALALIAGDERLSYAALERRVQRAAAGFAEAGVRPGDRVAILSWNSTAFVEAIHAVPRLGATLVPLNARLSASELAWQLRDADVRLLVAQDTLMPAAVEAAEQAAIAAPMALPLAGEAHLKGLTSHPGEAVHSILYTSGTTGRPKGAMLTYSNFWASAVGSAFNLGALPNDRWLACMPLFHVGGLSIVLRAAIYGSCVVLHEGFYEHAVVRDLRSGGVTIVSLVATMLQRLLDADDFQSPESLRVVLLGGGPVPLPLLHRAFARGFPVVQTYGLTEAASQVATLAPADAIAHAGSAGQPLLTTRLRVDASAGEPGEILVSGDTVTPGYFRRAEATAAAIRDGWLHTGDIGRIDSEGFLYVLDRRDDLIVSGGENVYPAEVEAALLSHPGVAGCAVVGLPDTTWGQVVTAAVVPRGTVSEAALREWLVGKIAAYKLPRRFVFLSELPTTASGKVQRHAVRDRLGSPPAANVEPPAPA